MIDKQQLQAMGEHQAEQQMCMAKQIEHLQSLLLKSDRGAERVREQRNYAYKMMDKFESERDEFARQLEAANKRISAMTELLSECRHSVEWAITSGVCGEISLARIDAALAGWLSDHVAGASKMEPGGSVSLELFERWFRCEYHPDWQRKFIRDVAWAGWQAALADTPKPEPAK